MLFQCFVNYLLFFDVIDYLVSLTEVSVLNSSKMILPWVNNIYTREQYLKLIMFLSLRQTGNTTMKHKYYSQSERALTLL